MAQRGGAPCNKNQWIPLRIFFQFLNYTSPSQYAKPTMDVGLSFGSVGDIIAICQLIIELGKALNDTTGSTAQYRELRGELDDFVRLLMQVRFHSPRSAREDRTISTSALGLISCVGYRCLRAARALTSDAES